CSSAVRGAGAPKRPPQQEEMLNDSANGGFAPATPTQKAKPLYEGKTKAAGTLPLVGPEALRLRPGLRKTLARTGSGEVKQLHVLGAVRWPVLKRSEERRVGKECRSRWSP